ncbi:cupin domain-containing protein [Amycolatopsis jejuensis]|uniref:cupin domain-containing protein n=1 Tax=Amycolatopsis jejuensis TaxID=330084 RepID=UPI00052688FE|nr:cupin domain-containing protein [Amycolatopsis jejuensis]
MRSFSRLAVAAATTVAAAVAVPAVADATPPKGVTGTIVWQSTLGGKDYILREIKLAPGGTTGWHWHDGTLYAAVRQGTLTHNLSDCSVDGIFSAGQTLTEPSGSGHVHIGRNQGTVPLILDVLYVNPAGAPLSEDAPNPGCEFP